MGKRQKIVLISILSVVILFIAGIVIAQSVLTSKIENLLSNSLPEDMKVEYTDLNLSVLSGSLTLEHPILTIYEEKTKSVILKNEMTSIHIGNIGYWNYLVNDKIDISKIQINDPKILFKQKKKKDSKEVKPKKNKIFDQIVNVKKFEINNGTISMLEVENDSLVLKINNFDINVKDIQLNEETLIKKIPFSYSDFHISFDDLFYELNKYDNLKIGKSVVSAEKINFSHFNLYTKYSKQKLSEIIRIERDHMDLKIENLTIFDEKFGYYQDNRFYFSSPKVVVSNPVFNIYRDKLKDDDLTIKSLYSKMLRELKFDLTLSEVLLKNSILNYSEKVKPDSDAGEISFLKLDGTIKNLSNTYESPERTDVDINAIFMKTTPIKVNWNFDVNNVNDHFVFTGNIGKLPAPDLNQFSEPNLKVLLEGELLKTYFTIDGNVQESSINLRANYDNFKVTVLDKKGENKNKFLSTIVNLIIKKDSDSEEDNFREGSKTGIERDKTKSIFNFIWMNAKSGLASALTGDGKK